MKLFKKVMASVLAGVLALSMAACGTAPVAPETPVVDPAATGAAQILDIMNHNMDVADAKLLETDKDLDKLAAAILDHVEEKGYWDEQNEKIALNNKQGDGLQAALAKQNLLPKANKVYVFNGMGSNGFMDVTKTANLSYNTCIFGGTYTEVMGMRAFGVLVDKAGAKLGIASKTINGKNVYVILTDKVVTSSN